MAQAAGTIVVADRNSPEFKKAVIDYTRLYWVKMPLVEDEKVETAAVQFRDALNKYLQNNISAELDDPKADLADRALGLSQAMRPFIQQAYDPILANDKQAASIQQGDNKK